MTDQELAEFSFEEEEYIDDILINSGCDTALCKYQKAVSIDFELEEEEYIDDITFNTAFVSAASLYLQAMAQNFDFEEEAFINDHSIGNDGLSSETHHHTLILKGFDVEEEMDIIKAWTINISFDEYSEKLLERISKFSFVVPSF